MKEKIVVVIARMRAVILSLGRRNYSGTHFRSVKVLRNEVRLLRKKLEQAPSEAQSDWNRKVNRLIEDVLSKDPSKFLTWKVIRQTMFVSYGHYIKHELEYLKMNDPNKWNPVLKEDKFGFPIPFSGKFDSSANLIHHTYHVAKFLEATNVKIDDIDLVLEFGGGYGSLARVFFKLGFKGSYKIFDFEVFNSLQKYYLSNILPMGSGKIEEIMDLGFYHEKPTLLTELKRAKGKRLFIATWSISETSLEFRNEFLKVVSDFDYFLIAFQHEFKEVDNLRFFDEWKELFESKVLWSIIKLEHIGEHSYLIGQLRK